MAAPTTRPVPVMSDASWPQIVPSVTCLQCDVCCRFPDPDSALRPYFTEREIERAVAGGIEDRHFSSARGAQISLVPDAQGEGYHCPAFDRQTSGCRIYGQRPLDCRLYPLAMMWSVRHDEVMLGWDSKCPFMRERIPDEIRQHADHVIELLRCPDVVETVASHPRLIGRFQEDVVQLEALPLITQALTRRWGTVPMHRLTPEDLPRMSAALAASGFPQSRSLAAYSVAYHYMCNELLAYWWTELEGAFYLFVESPDGWFMPLPPLTHGPVHDCVERGFSIMRQRNGASPVSRIENLSAQLASRLRAHGYRLTAKDGDYLYGAKELAGLAGDRYKSQRALCNRIERLKGVVVEPYHPRDRAACRMLMQQWRAQKQSTDRGSYGRWLLEDAASSHEIVWTHAQPMGLGGTVVRIDGVVRAYTFGYWLTDKTWCVLIEVADRTVTGLAQHLFRETCRLAHSRGAEFINTMDDAGLPGLRLSKQSYHPMLKIENFILSEDRHA